MYVVSGKDRVSCMCVSGKDRVSCMCVSGKDRVPCMWYQVRTECLVCGTVYESWQ